MIPAEMKLLVICDELLSATGALRSVCEKMGEPWDKSAAAQLINRLLDIRNQVSPPVKGASGSLSNKPQPKTQTS